MRIRDALFALLLGASALPAAVSAGEVGLVVKVTGTAVIVRDGARIAIRRGLRFRSDDIIATAPGADVQIVFDDRTRMVVGPESQLDVSDVEIGAEGRARTFAVRAVSGTFRFLSGESRKEVYSVDTPTATMGVRGTIFDFAVERGRPTRLVTLDGTVRICGRRNRCAIVRGGCAVAIVDRRSIEVPEDRRARDALLVSDFPYVLSQRPLRKEFRAPVDRCGNIARVVALADDPIRTRPAAPVKKVEPPPPPPPPSPPPPAPDPAGYPGQSGSPGNPGPSQGQGHVQSNNAGGLGKGHGKEKNGNSGAGNGNGKGKGAGGKG